MNMMAGHFLKPIAENRLEVTLSRAVEQFSRWIDRNQLKINVGGMSLVSSDSGSGLVNRESLFVAFRHDLIELVAAEWHAHGTRCRKKVLDEHPATWFQC